MPESISNRIAVQLSAETVRWIELAVKDYDPLTATAAENTPEKLACWAIHNLIARAGG